jgi:hypothetical protein
MCFSHLQETRQLIPFPVLAGLTELLAFDHYAARFRPHL